MSNILQVSSQHSRVLIKYLIVHKNYRSNPDVMVQNRQKKECIEAWNLLKNTGIEMTELVDHLLCKNIVDLMKPK
jgi:hypothetical protein